MDLRTTPALYEFKVPAAGDRFDTIILPIVGLEFVDTFSKALRSPEAPKPILGFSAWWKWTMCARPSKKHLSTCYLTLFRLLKMSKNGMNFSQMVLKTMMITENLRMKHALACVYADLCAGQTAAGSFANQPKIFTPTDVGQISAGEESKTLGDTFKSMSDYLQLIIKVQSTIIGQMIYPAIVGSALYVVMSCLLYFIVPRLADTFASMNADLPAFSVMVMDAGRTSHSNPVFLLIPGAMVIGAFLGRSYLIPLALAVLRRMPILGTFYLRATIASTAATLAVLLKNGVTIPNAVTMVMETCKEKKLKDAFFSAKAMLEMGESPVIALDAVFLYFGKLATDFKTAVEIGNQSNSIPEALETAAANYQEDYIRASVALGEVTGPAMTLMFGGVVGAFSLAMYYPLMTAGNAIH